MSENFPICWSSKILKYTRTPDCTTDFSLHAALCGALDFMPMVVVVVIIIMVMTTILLFIDLSPTHNVCFLNSVFHS